MKYNSGLQIWFLQRCWMNGHTGLSCCQSHLTRCFLCAFSILPSLSRKCNLEILVAKFTHKERIPFPNIVTTIPLTITQRIHFSSIKWAEVQSLADLILLTIFNHSFPILVEPRSFPLGKNVICQTDFAHCSVTEVWDTIVSYNMKLYSIEKNDKVHSLFQRQNWSVVSL